MNNIVLNYLLAAELSTEPTADVARNVEPSRGGPSTSGRYPGQSSAMGHFKLLGARLGQEPVALTQPALLGPFPQ
jgi:hypothetical protein